MALRDRLGDVIDEMFAPECPADCDDPADLGCVLAFGCRLTPDDADELAAQLSRLADVARKAVAV